MDPVKFFGPRWSAVRKKRNTPASYSFILSLKKPTPLTIFGLASSVFRTLVLFSRSSDQNQTCRFSWSSYTKISILRLGIAPSRAIPNRRMLIQQVMPLWSALGFVIFEPWFQKRSCFPALFSLFVPQGWRMSLVFGKVHLEDICKDLSKYKSKKCMAFKFVYNSFTIYGIWLFDLLSRWWWFGGLCCRCSS